MCGVCGGCARWCGLIHQARVEDQFDDLAEAKAVAFLELRDRDGDLADQIESMNIFVVEADLECAVLEEDKDLFLLPVRAECIALDVGL